MDLMGRHIDIAYDRNDENAKYFTDKEMTVEVDASLISDEALADIMGGVILVRCKDCRFMRAYYTGNPSKLVHDCLWWLRETELNEFCSYGRRDDG